jgi:hypothetical protein
VDNLPGSSPNLWTTYSGVTTRCWGDSMPEAYDTQLDTPVEFDVSPGREHGVANATRGVDPDRTTDRNQPFEGTPGRGTPHSARTR